MSDHRALENLTVLDLTRVLAGPFCTMMLADMGADVIKIEVPGGGDDTRGYPPFRENRDGERESLYFANINRNKRGVTLNLKTPEGKALFLRMAERADIVVENYRPGVMDRLGLGYEQLRRANPRIIYAAVSGFGSYGPYHLRPGYDILAQAMGGMMAITARRAAAPPAPAARWGISWAAWHLAIGILAAVNARHRHRPGPAGGRIADGFGDRGHRKHRRQISGVGPGPAADGQPLRGGLPLRRLSLQGRRGHRGLRQPEAVRQALHRDPGSAPAGRRPPLCRHDRPSRAPGRAESADRGVAGRQDDGGGRGYPACPRHPRRADPGRQPDPVGPPRQRTGDVRGDGAPHPGQDHGERLRRQADGHPRRRARPRRPPWGRTTGRSLRHWGSRSRSFRRWRKKRSFDGAQGGVHGPVLPPGRLPPSQKRGGVRPLYRRCLRSMESPGAAVSARPGQGGHKKKARPAAARPGAVLPPLSARPGGGCCRGRAPHPAPASPSISKR